MAELHVAIDGTVTTVGSASGVGGSAASPGFTSISQGGNTANVAVPGPNLGAGLVVTSGTLISVSSLAAVSATGAGSVADFGSAKQQITASIIAGAGVSAGVVALEVSHDATNWYRPTGSTLTAPGVTQVTVQGAWRYARGNVTTAITGGVIAVTIMAA